MKERVHERAARVSRRRVDDHPGRLVDDDDVVILINDGQRQPLGPWTGVDRFGNVDGDLLTCLDWLVRLGLAARDAYMAVFDEALNLGARALGENRDEKPVEPRTFGVVRDREKGHAAFRGLRARSGTGASFRRARYMSMTMASGARMI